MGSRNKIMSSAIKRIYWNDIRKKSPEKFECFVKSCVNHDSYYNFWFIDMAGELILCHKTEDGKIVYQRPVSINDLCQHQASLKTVIVEMFSGLCNSE